MNSKRINCHRCFELTIEKNNKYKYCDNCKKWKEDMDIKICKNKIFKKYDICKEQKKRD